MNDGFLRILAECGRDLAVTSQDGGLDVVRVVAGGSGSD